MSKVKSEACAVCGKGTTTEVRRHLRKTLLGHEATYARREFVCDTCDETYTDSEQSGANEMAERSAIRRALAHVGPEELRLARRFADMTQVQMEKALGLGRNTLARWETGQRRIPEYIKATYRLISLNPLAANLLNVEGVGVSSDEPSVATVANFNVYFQRRFPPAPLGEIVHYQPSANVVANDAELLHLAATASS